MIKVDITANNVASSYRVPMILGESILGLKWDSGAKYTVISVKVLNSDLSRADLGAMNSDEVIAFIDSLSVDE